MMVINELASVLLFALMVASVSGQSAASQAYTPSFVSCPNNFSLVRMAGSSADNQTLSSSESAYIQSRKANVIPQAWTSYLNSVQTSNVSLPSYVSEILGGNSSEVPNLGIATSGGGYRAAIFGAGVLSVLDGRNSTSVSTGIGGLLQAATYISALSGGSWMLTSWLQADYPTFQELVFGPTSISSDVNSWGGWLAQYDLFAPSDDEVTSTEYVADLIEEMAGKYNAGFIVTFADFWARTLSRHFANGTSASNFFNQSSPYTHGAGILLSGIVSQSSFVTHSIPFPIIVSDLQAPNQNESEIIAEDFIPLTNPIFEFNVFEMGSFDPILSAFTPTQYLGTQNTSICVTGFDQIAFIAGSSSELYNEYNITNILNTTIASMLTGIEELFPQTGVELDIASYPNAFYGIAPDTFIDSNQHNINLVDGGEDGEVVPLQPLLVKARGVDTIFAIDATNDDDGFTFGSSLIATQNRTSLFPTAYSFPPVPTSIEEFMAQNLSSHPTFFGCDSSTAAPLLIYLANGAPPRDGAAPLTNTSTAQSTYEPSEIQAMFGQIFDVATQGLPANGTNSTTDPQWPACLACAVVDRARNRTGTERSGVCASCFDRYCWSSSTETTTSTSGALSKHMFAIGGWSGVEVILAIASFSSLLLYI